MNGRAAIMRSSGSACMNRTMNCCRRSKIEFGLHALAIEDAGHAHQRPKLEIYGDAIFVVARTAHMADEEIVFGETHLFVGRG